MHSPLATVRLQISISILSLCQSVSFAKDFIASFCLYDILPYHSSLRQCSSLDSSSKSYCLLSFSIFCFKRLQHIFRFASYWRGWDFVRMGHKVSSSSWSLPKWRGPRIFYWVRGLSKQEFRSSTMQLWFESFIDETHSILSIFILRKIQICGIFQAFCSSFPPLYAYFSTYYYYYYYSLSLTHIYCFLLL